MTDKEKFEALFKEVGQPNYCYGEVGSDGKFHVMVVDENKDGARYVPLFYFEMNSGDYRGAATRYLDP